MTMEQVFRARKQRGWLYAGCVFILLFVVLALYLGKGQFLPSFCGMIAPVLILYSRMKTLYVVKDNGVVEIRPGLGRRICVDGVRRVSYRPGAIGTQKVKLEHAQGFVMISPDEPLEFTKALGKIYPGLSVEGFELMKTN